MMCTEQEKEVMWVRAVLYMPNKQIKYVCCIKYLPVLISFLKNILMISIIVQIFL